MSGKVKEIGQEQQVDFLRKIDFFHDFDDHELRQLLGVTTWLKQPPNTQIIQEGALERAFYILVKGTVAVFKTNAATGERISLTTIPTGNCFGEMSLVGEIRRTAGVVTSSECFLLKVEPEIIRTSNVFLQLKFYQRFCEILVNRLIEANERVTGKGTATAVAPSKKSPPVQSQPVARSTPAPKELPPQQATAMKTVQASVLPAIPEAIGRQPIARMQRRVAGLTSLAVNQEVAARISSYLYGTEQNTRKFAEIISLDPTLSFRVLQTANSSFFRRATPVLTVPHAMIIVGIDEVRETLRSTMEATEAITPFGGFPKRLGLVYWKYSVVVGRIADLLKEVLRINLAPDVYLAGLLHRIGTLVLDGLQPAFYPQLLRKGNDFIQHLPESETEFVGVDHLQAGVWFAKKWGIPEPYQEVMAHYRMPQKSREHGLLVSLVHLAILFAARRGVRFADGEGTDRPVAESFAWLLIKEQHRSFQEADIPSFVAEFDGELAKAWSEIISDTD